MRSSKETAEVPRVRSWQHLVISVAVGGVLAAVDGGATPDWALVAYAAVLGVGVDFDHFLIARVNDGSWRAAKFCLRNPSAVFLDQGAIFEPHEVDPLERLLSHAVVAGVVVAAAWVVTPFLAAASAAVLYAHVLADLVGDALLGGGAADEGRAPEPEVQRPALDPEE